MAIELPKTRIAIPTSKGQDACVCTPDEKVLFGPGRLSNTSNEIEVKPGRIALIEAYNVPEGVTIRIEKLFESCGEKFVVPASDLCGVISDFAHYANYPLQSRTLVSPGRYRAVLSGGSPEDTLVVWCPIAARLNVNINCGDE